MKRILLPTMLGGVSLLPSCSDNNTFFNEPSPIRAYETDAEILAQFVDVDNATGAFVINPDNKITASDYIVSHSREELMMVSSVNRDKFTHDMEAVNVMLRAVKQSGNSTAIIYSTYSSDKLVEGKVTDTYSVTKSATHSISENIHAPLVVTSEKSDERQFYTSRYVTMNLSANCSSKFYLYMISLGDDSNPDAGILIVAGLNSPQLNHSYIIKNNGSSDWLSVKGKNLVGDGTLYVSISQ